VCDKTRSDGSLVTATKPKAKYTFRVVAMLLYEEYSVRNIRVYVTLVFDTSIAYRCPTHQLSTDKPSFSASKLLQGSRCHTGCKSAGVVLKDYFLSEQATEFHPDGFLQVPQRFRIQGGECAVYPKILSTTPSPQNSRA
jgi:hypothetical protein